MAQTLLERMQILRAGPTYVASCLARFFSRVAISMSFNVIHGRWISREVLVKRFRELKLCVRFGCEAIGPGVYVLPRFVGIV